MHILYVNAYHIIYIKSRLIKKYTRYLIKKEKNDYLANKNGKTIQFVPTYIGNIPWPYRRVLVLKRVHRIPPVTVVFSQYNVA